MSHFLCSPNNQSRPPAQHPNIAKASHSAISASFRPESLDSEFQWAYTKFEDIAGSAYLNCTVAFANMPSSFDGSRSQWLVFKNIHHHIRGKPCRR
ncbi:Hypothetical predicted protein [Podarcis lilfordi]|uniref:Uncharacterized protein n=1 Tax=Podarcis lilfordi TaxID=74358 RepID=A0AA35NX47_9SAUR|nr:Hypothetical predicted protein [Podarcis lilfordi]